LPQRTAQLDRVSVAQALAEAGCIAAGEEADELIRAAAGDPDVLAGCLVAPTASRSHG